MQTKKNMLKGKWIARFNPAEFNYREILESLLTISRNLVKKNLNREYTDIVFAKNFKENTYHIKGKRLYLGLKDKNPENIRSIDEKIPGEAAVLPSYKIKNILLYQPFLMTDKRWQTISLTASAIFLGSALKDKGFDVRVKKLQLPAVHIEKDISNYDVIGFTLFEELLPEAREFLDMLSNAKRLNPAKILAAGGPLVTLNPLQAAYHLPSIDLFVRGEAELVFPGLLNALQENDLPGLLQHKGFLFQQPGLLVLSEFGEINRPADFTNFNFNLSFLEKEHLKNGLEINFSRGCRRGCLFCAKVQGKKLRKLPVDKIEDLLEKFSAALDDSGLPPEELQFARSLNINDDDILQDPAYARQVLALIKKQNFKCWGIQSSLASFLAEKPAASPSGGNPAAQPVLSQIYHKTIKIIDDRDVFINGKPLIWLGTDAFLIERGRRLGKRIPTFAVIESLVQEFESKNILNYHYWISSDHETTWAEFAGEFLFIHKLLEKYKTFAVIAHSPFVVPYCSTPLYRLLTKPAALKNGIRYKTVLKARQEEFTLPLAARVETPFSHLNKLLHNEGLSGKPGFFDSLKQKDYVSAFITLYNYLKQERLYFESLQNREQTLSLINTGQKIERHISRLI
jgi:hypothetical protein